MPYLEHFQLYRKPFDLTPTRALFFPEQHEQVLTALTYALERGDGIIKVVGEVGTGKTLLCRMLIHALMEVHEVAFMTAPRTDPQTITRAVASEFGIELGPDDEPFDRLHRHLLDVHASGKQAVLLVDEAQALDRRGLETMRLLSNLETDDAKLLQIVLFGQPELDDLLRQYGMRQLAQRVAFNLATHPFDAQTAMRYVQHRVDRSTDAPTPHEVFTPRALRALARESRGIPRILNILADRALLAAYADNATRADKKHVRRGVEEGILWPDTRPGVLGWFLRYWGSAT